jgi:hypothetical protein
LRWPRRGPLQAAFTKPELLELGALERTDIDVAGSADLDSLSARRGRLRWPRRGPGIIEDSTAVVADQSAVGIEGDGGGRRDLLR